MTIISVPFLSGPSESESGAYVKKAGPIRITVEELQRAGKLYTEAVEVCGRLAAESAAAGAAVTALNIVSGHAGLAGMRTARLTTGIAALKAEAVTIHTAIEVSVARYQAVEARVDAALSKVRLPLAMVDVVASLVQGQTPRADSVASVVEDGLGPAGQVVNLLMGSSQIVKGLTQPLEAPLNLALGAHRLKTAFTGSGAENVWLALMGVARAANLAYIAPYDIKDSTSKHLRKNDVDNGWIQVGQSDGSLLNMVDTASMAFPPEAGESAIMITKYTRDDGTISARVTVPGTQFKIGGDLLKELSYEANAFGLVGQLEGMNSGSQHLVKAIDQALDDAGIPEGTELIFDGWSQGGTHTANAAASPLLNDKYDVRGVVNYAGVDASIRLPDDVVGLNMYHERDIAVGLDAVVGVSQVKRREIVFTGGQNTSWGDGAVFGEGHGWPALSQNIRDATADPAIMHDIQPQLNMLGETTTGTAEAKIYTLTRQEPVSERNPIPHLSSSLHKAHKD